MDKRYRDKGLVIIAPERQNSSDEKIKALLKKHKVEYTVTSGGNGPVATRGIPHSFVFDVNGQLIFSGDPDNDDFERTIKRALKEASGDSEDDSSTASSGPLFSSRTWTNSDGKTIKAEVLALEGDKVKFRMPNSSIILYDLSKLSEEDQKAIKEKAGQSE
ncbi:hypothetical protein [Rubritalea halochordaticola]